MRLNLIMSDTCSANNFANSFTLFSLTLFSFHSEIFNAEVLFREDATPGKYMFF